MFPTIFIFLSVDGFSGRVAAMIVIFPGQLVACTHTLSFTNNTPFVGALFPVEISVLVIPELLSFVTL